MKYLLPCQQCSEKLVVDVSQAGRQLTCRCGATLEVPSLRAIRALETVAETAAQPPQRSWNPTRGVVFALGLVVALVGLSLAGVAGFGWVNAKIPPPPVVDAEATLAELDGLVPAAAWDAWVDLRNNGIGPYVPPAKFMAELSVQRVFRVMVGGFVVLAVGLAMAVGSLLLRGTQGPRKTPVPRRPNK